MNENVLLLNVLMFNTLLLKFSTTKYSMSLQCIPPLYLLDNYI